MRLVGIDSYELRSPQCEDAKLIAKQLTEKYRYKSGELYLQKSGTDKYGRFIGDIKIDGIMLSKALVDGGYAWYHEFKKNKVKKSESHIR